jgi:hypothetical protein
MVLNVAHVLTSIIYQLKPAPVSAHPVRENGIFQLTIAPSNGCTSSVGVGAVVSSVICFATLNGLSVPLLNKADIFFIPSHGVKLIACKVYGYGASSGTPITVGLMFPLMDTLLCIFANSAACSCVVFV